MKEIWKSIPNYENLYEISNLGNVKNLTRNFILSINKNHKYCQVELRKNAIPKTFLVHRLVAEVFIPNPFNLSDVNHINKIGTDNTYTNLEWSSKSNNIKHNYRTGLKSKIGDYTKGKSAYNAKLVLNTETGIYYENSIEAANSIGKTSNVLRTYLSGNRPNRTSLIYC